MVGEVLAAEPWSTYAVDPNLRNPPSPGSPGRVPPGSDLALNIGWDRFEKLMLAVSRRMLGLRGIKFRRYGVQGQEQFGIDLAGREPDGRYSVVQCKDYKNFTPGQLRKAVEKFTGGPRPFGAYRLIVATSASTEATQIADELATLQREHPDLELQLWGSEQINECLRYCGDIVAQFWTRETAVDFCTGAPLPGVPAPPPDRQAQAERILVGPLNTEDVTPILREADSELTDAPAVSARLYGDLADRLHEAGYEGHANVLRRKQLGALKAAGHFDDAADLAAELAVAALHRGDRDEPRALAGLLAELASSALASGTERAAVTNDHATIVGFAVRDISHPVTMSQLLATLKSGTVGEPRYRPMLVLLLAEDRLATEPHRLDDLDDLIGAALAQATEPSATAEVPDIAIRLRLLRAEYDSTERQELLRAARRHQLKGRHAALVNAREARRCALEGRAEEALESWRDAVQDGIHAGLAEEAADWLYAIRALNVQYGPWNSEIDDEHRLAQALRATGTSRLLDRVRAPRAQAMAAQVRSKPIEAVLSARRWLTDSVVTGSWADENEALTFLADLYRDNSEPVLAATYYQRAGEPKKVKQLAETVGDALLPLVPFGNEPWWVLRARANLAAAQADLVEDAAVEGLFNEFLDLAARGRAGELTDSRTHALTLQATKSACAFVSRSTVPQAEALLALLAPDVPRGPNQYRHTDDEHAIACVDIALAHPGLAMQALTRLFDLADGRADKALKLLAGGDVLRLVGTPVPGKERPREDGEQGALSENEREVLRGRADRLALKGHYLADVIQAQLSPGQPAVQQRAQAARDRLLQRPEPDPTRTEFGDAIVIDAFMASCLPVEEQQGCLDKLLAVAADRRETASNRQDALVGARNLVIDQVPTVKHTTFRASQPFVLGEQDGSRLDELTGEAHPLSSFRISLGSASLRDQGLALAVASAVTREEHEWVRNQAIGLLRSDEQGVVQAAAVTLNRLPRDVTSDVDANLLAAHASVGVRQLSAVLCMEDPERFRDTAMRLAEDREPRVRRTLAEAAARAVVDSPAAVGELLDRLREDPRHSVRAATRRQA